MEWGITKAKRILQRVVQFSLMLMCCFAILQKPRRKRRSDERDIVLESIFAVRAAKTDLPAFSILEHAH